MGEHLRSPSFCGFVSMPLCSGGFFKTSQSKHLSPIRRVLEVVNNALPDFRRSHDRLSQNCRRDGSKRVTTHLAATLVLSELLHLQVLHSQLKKVAALRWQ